MRLKMLTVAAVTAAVLIFATGVFFTSWLRTVNMTKTEKYLFGTGSFGLAPDSFVKDEEYYDKDIMTRWYNSVEDTTELAYMMYRRACLTYGSTAQKSWRLYGEGKVAAGGATGKLTAGGYRYEKRRGNTLFADSVLQNVNMLSNLEGEAGGIFMLELARGLVEYGEQRVYTVPYEFIRVADKNSFYLDGEYDVASAEFTSKAARYDNPARIENRKNKGYVYREYDAEWYDPYGLNSPEKTDHIINAESIVPGSVSVTPSAVDGRTVYKLVFDVDCLKILSSGTTASYYFEQFILNHMNLKDGSFSSFKVNVKYNSLKITMEIWDCGYIRSWITDEDWTVTAKLGISIPAQTVIRTMEYYSYDPADNRFDGLMASFTGADRYVDESVIAMINAKYDIIFNL